MPLDDDPYWYKHAIIYELSVRGFYDSNADGIGDFAGLTEKLDYLQRLGVNCLWLLPFSPSPMRDGGYDVQERSPRDRRSVLIRLTDKGLALCQHLRELDDRLALAYSEGDGANVDIASARLALRQLERLWSDYIQYGRI